MIHYLSQTKKINIFNKIKIIVMEEKITSIVTDDRLDEILHCNATKDELIIILNYILMDYKKFAMTDKILLNN